MIHATTQRLIFRDLEVSDFPRVVELIGDWEVSRWLAVVPHPYELRHAQEFYDKLKVEAGTEGGERFFAIAETASGDLIGGVGLRGERTDCPDPHTTIVGYWIGKPYWGRGYMSEALAAALQIAFAFPRTAQVVATTHPDNHASMNVLRKAGFMGLGLYPISEPNLWGRTEETRWGLRREDFNREG